MKLFTTILVAVAIATQGVAAQTANTTAPATGTTTTTSTTSTATAPTTAAVAPGATNATSPEEATAATTSTTTTTSTTNEPTTSDEPSEGLDVADEPTNGVGEMVQEGSDGSGSNTTSTYVGDESDSASDSGSMSSGAINSQSFALLPMASAAVVTLAACFF